MSAETPVAVTLTDDDLDALSEAGSVIVCTSDCCNHYVDTYSPEAPCSTLRVITEIVERHVAATREQVAADIEDAAGLYDRSSEWRDGMDEATRIARGGTR